VRLGDSSCIVDDGRASVKVLNCANAKFGQVSCVGLVCLIALLLLLF
jgi:hypothetical protein